MAPFDSSNGTRLSPGYSIRAGDKTECPVTAFKKSIFGVKEKESGIIDKPGLRVGKVCC
jgi:hypothetical protein